VAGRQLLMGPRPDPVARAQLAHELDNEVAVPGITRRRAEGPGMPDEIPFTELLSRILEAQAPPAGPKAVRAAID
jgi:hypothetical protein